jgi:hypothetical protein
VCVCLFVDFNLHKHTHEHTHIHTHTYTHTQYLSEISPREFPPIKLDGSRGTGRVEGVGAGE